jgi:hypothetical protein
LVGEAHVHPDAGSDARDDALEASVNAACDGDPRRAAVRALIVANNFLCVELERVTDLVSRGFVRRPDL